MHQMLTDQKFVRTHPTTLHISVSGAKTKPRNGKLIKFKKEFTLPSVILL